MLGKFFKKYGKHLISFVILMALVLPLAANQASAALSETVKTQLDNSNLGDEFVNSEGDNALAVMIGNIIRVLLGMLGLILVILIVYAGFLWTTAQGDPAKVKKAQDMIKQAIIGMIIVFAAYAIANFVISNLTNAATNNMS